VTLVLAARVARRVLPRRDRNRSSSYRFTVLCTARDLADGSVELLFANRPRGRLLFDTGGGDRDAGWWVRLDDRGDELVMACLRAPDARDAFRVETAAYAQLLALGRLGEHISRGLAQRRALRRARRRRGATRTHRDR